MDPQKIIDKISDLPTLPSVAMRINTELENESLTANKLGKIISEDTALASKLLRLANSAFYGLPSKVTTMDRAVTLLGFNTIKNLALSIAIYNFFEKDDTSSVDVRGLWEHSLGCAVAAKILAEKSNKRLGDDAFLLGILHDIGKIVFIKHSLADMEKVQQRTAGLGIEQAGAEKEVFGLTHQEVGTLLLRKWNFPETIISGVRLHHDLSLDTKKLDYDTAQTIRALIVGNQMAKALSFGQSIIPKHITIPPKMWNFLGVKKDDMSSLKAAMKDQYGKILAAWS
jgi:HD-like signal output (HDOD) protein